MMASRATALSCIVFTCLTIADVTVVSERLLNRAAVGNPAQPDAHPAEQFVQGRGGDRAALVVGSWREGFSIPS